MKFSKGVVKNINKKLLTGTLILTLVTTPLTGCSSSTMDCNRFEYSVNEQGEYDVSGTVDYEVLKEYYFLVVENSSYNTTEFYICYKDFHHRKYQQSYNTYYNIFNNQEIFDESLEDNRTILFSGKLEDYLFAYNKIKANYKKEDVEQILEEMKKNYLKENNKQLVKEK